MTRKLSFAAVGAASLLLAACGSTESGTITLTLEHLDCQQRDALASVQRIEVTVRGPGMDDVTASADKDDGSLSLPEIPAGADREVTVKGTNGAAAVYAIGHSEKFKVVADQDLAVTVPMVALNAFHSPESAAGECTKQTSLRAGQSSASFPDGKTVLVGGFQVDEGESGPVFRYLDTVELYDPATGAFTALAPLPALCGSGTESCARAFAPAVVQKTRSGRERILVIGGEYRGDDGQPLARGEILALDPDPGTDPATWTWKVVPMQAARRFHTASVLGSGDVIVVGGFGNPATPGDPIPVVESAEKIKRIVETDDLQGDESIAGVARALHGATVVGEDLVIAGGVDGTGHLPTDVVQGNSNGMGSSTGVLAIGVVGPTLAAREFFVRDPEGELVRRLRLAVIGGIAVEEGDLAMYVDPVGDFDPAATVPVLGLEGFGNAGQEVVLSTDRLAPGAGSEDFPTWTGRSFACAAPIDADRTLIVGGVTERGMATDSAEILVWVDQSQCVPIACSQDTECLSPSRCVDGSCRVACTEDSVCGTYGSCEGDFCRSDLAVPAHRCVGAARGCFAGSECIVDGKFDQSYAAGVSSNQSKLLEARAWGSCSRLSDDQILMSGGIGSDSLLLDSAELYEITHAGR